MQKWHAQALANAEKHERQDAANQQKEYKQFLADGSTGAAGLIHRLSKPLAPWQPVIGDRQERLLSPEDAAEHEAAKLKKVWEVSEKDIENEDTPWQAPLTADEREETPRLTVDEVRQVSRSSKSRTGIGANALHPKSLAHLSDECTQAVANMFEFIEDNG